MSINQQYQVERKEVMWNGQVAGDVRGLTPNDIMSVVAENPKEADMIFSIMEEEADLSADASPDDIATSLESAAKTSMSKVVAKAPNIIAKLIATACDSPDHWEFVRDKFVLPLQFEMLQEVARLTFIDPPAFRRFLGNVMALVGAIKGGQRQPSNTEDSDG